MFSLFWDMLSSLLSWKFDHFNNGPSRKVYSLSYAFSFVVLIFWRDIYHWIDMFYLPPFFRVASQALTQSYDCPSASEGVLNDMGLIVCYLTTTKRNKARTVCVIPGCRTHFTSRSHSYNIITHNYVILVSLLMFPCIAFRICRHH